MNVVAHDKAYSFFPKATFEQRRSLRRFGEGHPHRDLATQKYTLRGWSMVNSSDIHSQPRGAFPLGGRYIGDRACWTIPVHPAVELPCGLVEGNSWHMTISPYSPFMPVTITATIISTRELKFRYMMSFYEINYVRGHLWPHILSLKVSGGTRYVYNQRLRVTTR